MTPCGCAVGIVLSAPLLGGPKSWNKRRQGLLHLVLAAADLLAVAWMVSLYTFQVSLPPSSPSHHCWLFRILSLCLDV